MVSTILTAVFEDGYYSNSAELRYAIYDNIYSSNFGEIDVDSNNLLRPYYRLSKIINGEEVLINAPDHYYTRSPYSSFVFL